MSVEQQITKFCEMCYEIDPATLNRQFNAYAEAYAGVKGYGGQEGKTSDLLIMQEWMCDEYAGMEHQESDKTEHREVGGTETINVAVENILKGSGVMLDNRAVNAFVKGSGVTEAESKYPIDSEISGIVDNALTSKQTGSNTIGTISKAENKAINSLTNAGKGDGYRGKFAGGKHIATNDSIRHAIKGHKDVLREALRAQLPLSAEDVKRTLSAIKNQSAKIANFPTKTKEGRDSILQIVPVNGYTLYAEELMGSSKSKIRNLIGHTIYKAPTLPTAAVHATSARTLPRRQSEVLYKSIITGASEKSIQFVTDKAGNAADLYYSAENEIPTVDRQNGGLILLSSSSDIIQSNVSGSEVVRHGFVKMQNPFYITDSNRVFSNSETDVSAAIANLRQKGYDGFIFDYKPGDNFAVMVFNKEQIVSSMNDYRKIESTGDMLKGSGIVTEEVSKRYMELAQDPVKNRSELQEIVRAVAMESGYPVEAYHGTPISGITVFDSKKIGSNTDDGIFGHGFYLTTDLNTAKGYAGENGNVMSVYVKINKSLWANAYHNAEEVANMLGMDESALSVRKVGLSNAIAPRGGQERQFTSHLIEAGYDTVIVQHGKHNYEIVKFNPSEIKSADPVTYDADGNIIPIEERFKTDRTGTEEWKNKDIRFSQPIAESNTEKITPDDIAIIRSIGRKSVNDFTSEDIQKAEKWARQLYGGLTTRSPFFRAWFGDWRQYQTNKKIVAAVIPEYVPTNEARKANRGTVVNSDTDWNIRISREGETNTISHSGGEKLSEYGLGGIRSLVENAILLDTEVHEHHSNNSKYPETDKIAFDHKLYSLGISNDGTIAVYRITVEESYHDKNHPNERSFHNLKYIEKVATVGGRTASFSLPGVSTNDSIATEYSVADLYAFVKKNDKEFHAGKSVDKALLNPDGTPKIVYHQTGSRFWVFDTNNPVAAAHDSETPNGIFFKENDHDIGVGGDYVKTGHGGNVQMAVYLSAQHMLHFKNRAEARAWYEKNVPGYKELHEQMERAVQPILDRIDKLTKEEFNPDNYERVDELFALENEEIRKLGVVETEYRVKLRDLLNDYFLNGNSEYDGIELIDDGHRYIDGKRENVHTYIVFKPTQIKSATDNIGTFNGKNPDIRFSQPIPESAAEYAYNLKQEQAAVRDILFISYALIVRP